MKTQITLLKLLAIVLLLFSNNVQASHLMGGQITYSYVSGTNYMVRYVFYRDCAGITAPTSVQLIVQNGATTVSAPTLNRISITDVSILCPGQVSTCVAGGASPGVEEHVYEGLVSLPAGTITLSVSQNARNAAITTLIGASGLNMYLSASINTTIAAGNSSPNFLNKPIAQFCLGQASSISPNANDANGDVIVYSLVAPRQAAGTNVPYAAGFSALNPLTSSTGVSIDPSTGVISFTPSAVTTQVAVIAVLAQEYRIISGVQTKIGEVYRDLQVRLTGCGGNASPVIAAIPNAIVGVGVPFCTPVTATDAAGQVVTLTAVSSVGSLSTTPTTPGGVTNGQWCFTPTVTDQGNTYTVSINAQDNSCPLPGTSVRAFNITVPAPCNVTAVGSSTPASCGASDGTASADLLNSTGTVNYSWTGPNGFNTSGSSAISGLAPGTYHVTMVDGFQCADETDIIVGGSAGVQISPSVVNTTCGTNNGSITIVASAGVPPYSYALDNAPSQLSEIFSGLGVGTYSITVTDDEGCTGSVNVTVNPDADGTNPVAVCEPAVTVYLDDLGYGFIMIADVDNGSTDNCSITNSTLSVYNFSCSDAGSTIPVTLQVEDAAGNQHTCVTQVSVVDNLAPEHVDCSPFTLILDNNGLATLNPTDVADIAHITGHEACGIQSVVLSQTNFDCSHIGPNTVTLTVTDVNSNVATCTSIVTVEDNEAPVINCPGNISIAANSGGCKGVVTYTVTVSDNCGTTVQQTAGLPSGSAFPLGTTTNTFTVTDAGGLSATCSFDVTITSSLAVSAGVDEKTYYGYSMDQTVNRTVTASGGAGGYSYSWSLSRPLMCNIVSSTGDESFSGGSCTHNACPSSGSPLYAPSCISTTGAVSVKLIEDADACITVTDARGCQISDCFNIKAVDARCFAGNSSVQKVKVCHKTGSASNPWVQICIADAAVPTHLAENNGDCVGLCPCGTRMSNATSSSDFGMQVYPNPGSDQVTIKFDAESQEEYELTIFSVNGAVVLNNSGSTFEGGNEIVLPVRELPGGVYSMRLRKGNAISTVRLVVGH